MSTTNPSRQQVPSFGMEPASPSSPGEGSITSPARGRETRTALLQKLRSPPLVHAWDCWIERPPTSSHTSALYNTTPVVLGANSAYVAHLTHLLNVEDVRSFWSLFNNLPLSTLPQRHTCHLFHAGVKPLWEDPRNYRGGAWSFRIPRSQGPMFFTELALLAIGEQLQNAIEDKERTQFQDDICGISFSPRNASVTVVSVWNRDAGNEEGLQRVLQAVLDGVDAAVKPKEGTWYYKRHDSHEGFVAPSDVVSEKASLSNRGAPGANRAASEASNAVTKGSDGTVKPIAAKAISPVSTMDRLEEDVRKVRQILEDIRIESARS